MLRALAFSTLLCVSTIATAAMPQPIPASAAINAKIAEAMKVTNGKGLAIAVIDDGKVTYVHSYGIRNARGDPLQTDTVMYGASLTKTVFAYTVMQLVDQGRIKLDTPIADDSISRWSSTTPMPSIPINTVPIRIWSMIRAGSGLHRAWL